MPLASDQSADPLISVIIPIYNGADFLPEALETLRNQNYHPLDIILIDDGSTDDTPALAAGFCVDTPEWQVRTIRQDNAGPSIARNTGLRCARGDLIQFLDVDDLLPPDKLRQQSQRLLQQPELDVISGYMQIVRLPGADPRNMFFDQTEPLLGYNLGAALFRRRVFERIGDFNAAFRLAEDIDLFFRIIEANCALVIRPQVTLYYRQHEHNVTRGETPVDHQRALMRAFHESVKRRRIQGDPSRPLAQMEDFVEADIALDE